ncbi:MAG: hypothetical protein ABJD07_04350 [Gemmatimonadaceae bacterium]
MADSFLGDIGNTVGATVGSILNDGTVSGIGSAIGEAVSHLELDVSAATAALTQSASTQVVEAVHDLGHPVTQEELDDLVHKAQDADAHKIEAEALQHQQAKAAEEGDYHKAHELQHDAEWNLQAAADAGGHVGTTVVDAQKEGAALGNADWQQQIAHEAVHDSVAYAESGDLHTAANYAHIADDHAATAADYGHAGDHGSVAAPDTSADAAHDSSAATE